MLFRGTTVRVEGSAPAHLRLGLVLVGQEAKVDLKRKGKVWNVLWMNVGKVTFDRVPSLHLAFADADGAGPDGLAVPAQLRPEWGYDGIEARALPADADESTRSLFREFIRLKEREKLYSFGALRRRVPSEGAASRRGTVLVGLGGPAAPARFSAEFALPARTPAGVYEVRLIGYRGGAGELLASEKLTVERVGLARLVASMAHGSGLLYGIFSVAAALAAGFLSGILFSGTRKGH